MYLNHLVVNDLVKFECSYKKKIIVYDSDNSFFLRIYFWTYKCRAKNRNLDKYISSYLFYC